MKVLHVIPSVSERSGGPGQAIFPMCQSLQEQGAEVLIVTTDHVIVSSFEFRVPSSTSTDARDSESSMPNNQSLARNSKLETRNYYKGVPTLFFPSQWADSFKYSRPLASWLDSNVNSFDVVHIHAVFNHACIAAARACKRHGVPYVVRPLGTLDPWSMKQKPLRKALFWKLAGKRMLRDAAAVHYTASAEQHAVEESLGLNHGTVIPLGVDISAEDSQDLQQDFPALSNGPYVLVLSRLHPKKGLDVLLNAFLPLAKQKEFSNWRLVLAGDGPPEYVGKLKQQVAAENAADIVLFPGWLEGRQKSALLQSASLLALPSRQENFGLCVIEALAFGVPVLLTPQVNLAEDIKAANAGWIAALDMESIQKALAEAMRSPEERALRGRAGKNFAADFAWPIVASQLSALYTSVQLHES